MFRNVSCAPSRVLRGEGFEGSSVVRVARGKTCLRLPSCRQGTLENGDGRPEWPRPDVPPGFRAEKRYAAYLTNQRGESQANVTVYLCDRLVAQSLGGIRLSGVCPQKKFAHKTWQMLSIISIGETGQNFVRIRPKSTSFRRRSSCTSFSLESGLSYSVCASVREKLTTAAQPGLLST